MNNPLLEWGGPTPPWNAIQPEHLEPAIDRVLADNRALIKAVLAQDTRDWDSVVAPLEEAENRLHKVFQPGAHLHAVQNSPPWRQAYENCLPKLTAYSSELGQNTALFAAYQEVSQQADLVPAQRRLLDNALRDFRLSGVALADADKQRYREIQQRLAELSNRFERNLLDATEAFRCHITDEQRLEGLPQSARQMGAAKAAEKQLEGWVFGLDFPSFDAVMSYADDRQWRAQMYRAYTTRASDQAQAAESGERWDNAPLIEDILRLKAEEAVLLGYANFAELSLASKMADSPRQVEDFLLELANKAKPAAQQELAELHEFARRLDGPERLEPWDIAYYSEKLKQERFGLEDEQLKPYFALPKVLDGLFAAARQLFAVSFAPLDLPCWHPDVSAYAVHDADDQLIAWFYLDPCAREQKRGGAWMNDMAGRLRNAHGVQIPIATLTCNFAPASADQPALLTHDDAVTLFHEFGHGLQHMLTTVDYLSVSGINGVPWDAVELASQFMENWCWEEAALGQFARHFQTGEPIPGAWIEQIRASRVFHAGLAAVRQIELALFDLRLHSRVPAPDVETTLAEVRQEVAVMFPPPWNRFANSFSHIFAGGYAAGYFSYKWAEVLAADAFEAFREVGIFDAATGQRFKACILEPGGSEDAMELFKRFRGREPSVDALLRQDGLLAGSAEVGQP